MDYIHAPNLPQSKVSLTAVGRAYQSILAALNRMDIHCIALSACNTLAAPVQFHADMLIHHLGGDAIVVNTAQAPEISELEGLGFTVTALNRPLGATYPFDCTLNAARIGNRLICGKATSPEILRHCNDNEIRPIFCPQGYAKCSVCIISENALITADPSIAALCRDEGIDVLEIRAGHIHLEGYPYGFIGGCSGMLAQGLIAFTGILETHPDAQRMIDFMNKHDVKHICLTENVLTDIGGILPLACN